MDRYRRGRGQALVEFALITPVMILTIFGVFEGSLLMFSSGSARFGAGEAARVLSQEATVATADTDAIAYVRNNTPLGATALVSVTAIDIYRVAPDASGKLARDSSSVNSYRLDGSLVPATTVNWPPGARNASAYNGDYVGVDVTYSYAWKNGLFSGLFGPGVSSKVSVWSRIEPQVY